MWEHSPLSSSDVTKKRSQPSAKRNRENDRNFAIVSKQSPFELYVILKILSCVSNSYARTGLGVGGRALF
jgi:hypothetical protein